MPRSWASRAVSAAPSAATAGSSTLPCLAVTRSTTFGTPWPNRSSRMRWAWADSEPGSSNPPDERCVATPPPSTPDRTNTMAVVMSTALRRRTVNRPMRVSNIPPEPLTYHRYVEGRPGPGSTRHPSQQLEQQVEQAPLQRRLRRPLVRIARRQQLVEHGEMRTAGVWQRLDAALEVRNARLPRGDCLVDALDQLVPA